MTQTVCNHRHGSNGLGQTVSLSK